MTSKPRTLTAAVKTATKRRPRLRDLNYLLRERKDTAATFARAVRRV
jgi:hypothetical protein